MCIHRPNVGKGASLEVGEGGLTVLKVAGIWEICFLQGEKQDLRNEKIERLIVFVFIIP